MDTITLLNRCRAAAYEIARMEDAIERLSASGAGAADMLSSAIHQRDERQRRYTAELVAVNALLSTLPMLDCSIAYRYYIGGQSVSSVAKAVAYSVPYVKRVKARALTALKDVPQADIDSLLPGWYV